MTAFYFVAVALALCAASAFLTTRSEAWSDRCLYLAYAALFFAAWTLWS